MIAAVLRVELHIPQSRSLKAKRAVLRPFIEGLKQVASLSVSEVDHHDAWKRASVGVAVVAPDVGMLDRLVDSMRRYLDAQLEMEILEVAISYLEDPL